uniref:hypothetical protein n=1 Tax=Cupriavidus yeoncheonensis TaxID=1462994 RepID=UPI003F4919FC
MNNLEEGLARLGRVQDASAQRRSSGRNVLVFPYTYTCTLQPTMTGTLSAGPDAKVGGE